jgi:hypothetical protein
MKIKVTKLNFLYIVLSFLLIFVSTEKSFSNESIMQPGEELVYEVSAFGFKLGTIKIITEDQEKLDNKIVNKAKSIMQSYTGIKFIGLSAVYQSWIDESVSFSYKFVGNVKFLSDKWVYEQILFNYKSNKINWEKWEGKNRLDSANFYTNKKWVDGLSLFFLARQFTNINRNIKVPTFIGKDTAYTSLNFKGKRENVQIDAINYPVKTVYFSGTADWEGVYGLKGFFEGWFSDDDASVPIKAKVNVLIGSVKIELIRWKRNNWTPPKG